MSAARRMLSMTYPPHYRERTTPLSLRVNELLEGPGRSSVEAHPASERTHLIGLQFEGDLRRSILRALLRVKDVDEAFGGRLYRVRLRVYLLELDALQILAVDPQAYLSALDGRGEYPIAALGLQVLGDLKIPHPLHLGHPLPPAP